MKGKLLQRLRKDIAGLGSPNKDVSIEAEHRICRAAGRLKRFGSKAIQLLIDATAHSNPQVRFRSGWALAATRAPGAFESVLALTDDPDPFVRYEAVMALGRFGYVEAAPKLMDLACQPSREDCVDSAAGTALYYLGRPVLRSVLPLLQEENPRVRDLAVWWLGLVGPRTTIDLVADALRDTNTEVRTRALEALGSMAKRFGEARCIDLVADLRLDSDDQVRRAAVGELGVMAADSGELDCMTMLSECLTDADAEVRQSADFWLKQARDGLRAKRPRARLRRRE